MTILMKQKGWFLPDRHWSRTRTMKKSMIPKWTMKTCLVSMKSNCSQCLSRSFRSCQSANLLKRTFWISVKRTRSVLFVSVTTKLERSTLLCLVCIVSTRIAFLNGLIAKTLVPCARPEFVMNKKTQEAAANDKVLSKDLSEMYLFLMIEIAIEVGWRTEWSTVVFRIYLEIPLTVIGSSRESRSDQWSNSNSDPLHGTEAIKITIQHKPLRKTVQ